MNDATPTTGADDMRLFVDALHPWLGLASYTEETRGYFYGREDEVAELGRRVQRKLLTILFGQSGLGKTSILRAGIVPRLRPEGYCPVYVRIDYSPDSPVPTEQIKQAIFRATQAVGAWTQPGTAISGESLWEFLHHRDDILRDSAGKTLIPLLIFDQFEELFTLAQSDAFGRERAAQFIDDLSDLVENRAPKALEAKMDEDESAVEDFDFTRSDYRILIALREDYLAHLEGLKGTMPSISQNRMRLARMTGAQALSAVVKPGGRLVSEEVAGSIVRFVAGGAELANAEVEPALLSLICRELNNARITQNRSEISADLLAGSRDNILTEFYERALADQPAGVRQFIEDNLLTESGHRESLAEERVHKGLAAAGAPPGALATLVNRRLLRIEERLDVRRVELTHDVLTGVVRASRDVRLEREARDEAERKLASQRAREMATRKALVRARQIAAVCAVLAIGAAASAVFGYFGMKRAQEAEARAQQTRQMAEQARGEAEKLIVYLLDDFYLELEPVGRLDIVADLAKRALDYYRELPAELRTAQTDRNRALALVRYGAALRSQSKLDESQQALSEAVSVLRKLRSDGDTSEATAIGLGIGLMSEARVADSQIKRVESMNFAVEAVEVLKPLMVAAAPSPRLQRAYGLTMNYLGFTQLRQDQEETAVNSLEEARATYRAIDGLSLSDLPAAAGFAESSAWAVNAYQNLGRNDDARRVGGEGTAVAAKVLEKRPGHIQALRANALINDSLAFSEADELHMKNALAMTMTGARGWEEMVRIDPTNQIAWNNLAAARMGSAFGLQRLGRIGESAAQFRSALSVERETNASTLIADTLSGPAGNLAALEADRGNRQAADIALAENVRLTDLTNRGVAPENFGRAYRHEVSAIFAFALPVAAGDYATARTLAQASAQRLAALKTTNPSQELNRNKLLLNARYSLADAHYRLGDYAAAEKEIALAMGIRQQLPKRTTFDARDAADDSILAAMIAARQGHMAEAQRFIEPALKLHRELYARGNDDQFQHLQLARALYASALSAPAQQRAAQLAEAAALVDALSSEYRSLRSTVLVRNDVAAERKGQSK